MITDVVQRWRGSRTSYRPAGEVIDPRRYEVAAIEAADNEVARAFVLEHHYSDRWLAPRERVGLYRGAQLVGVAVFSQPGTDDVLAILPCPPGEAVELGRLVLLDDVPGNGESWFIARALDVIRARGYAGLLTFADPVPRQRADGSTLMPGHRGIVYQASSMTYTGRATPRTLKMLPDGTVFSEFAWSKIRRQVRGWEYATRQLVAAGAAPWDGAAPIKAWALREINRICTSVRHRGNHRYVLGLDRATRRALPAHLAARGVAVQPYPRAVDAPTTSTRGRASARS